MSSGPTKSSNLMVRKSRHVILKENKSAERLKLEDIPCPESIGLNKNEISLSEHQKQSLKYILDAKKININEDIFLPAAYKWEAPQNKVLTPSHSSTYLSAVSAPAKEPQISVRKSSTSFLLKTIDFVVNLFYTVTNCFVHSASNEFFWNVLVVVCNVFTEIFFQLVIGIATVMIAVILNLDESYKNRENRKTGTDDVIQAENKNEPILQKIEEASAEHAFSMYNVEPPFSAKCRKKTLEL